MVEVRTALLANLSRKDTAGSGAAASVSLNQRLELHDANRQVLMI